MKVEVINSSTEKPIKTYSVPDFYMRDFQKWQEWNEAVINLGQLSDHIAKLDSKDLETNEPISNPRKVDFYLPDPITDQVISQRAKLQTDPEESPDQVREKVTEQVSTPALKSSTILAAVVTEILQNHHPHSDYKVKISDE